MTFAIVILSILCSILSITCILIYKQNSTQNPELSDEYKNKEKELLDCQIEYATLQGEHKTLLNKLEEINERNNDLEGIIKNKDDVITELKSKNSFLNGENERLKEENKIKIELEEKLKKVEIENKENSIKLEGEKKKIEDLMELEKQIKNEFKVISNEIIKEQKETFSKEQNESLDHLLAPLNKDIKEFKDKIQQVQDTNNTNTVKIEENIKNLLNTTNDIGKKADNLATALKGDKKAQGNWGELQLQNLFEMSGLEEGVSFFKQYNIKNDNGDNFYIDFLIKLPEDRILIADSKVSMVNYDKYISANTQEEKRKYLALYCEDIKKHIKILGSKEYQNVYKEYNKKFAKDTPDFVFMFVAIEGAYIDAIKFDNSLFKFASDNKVALVTSSSFMPVLRMIEHLWNMENQNKYIANIIELSKRMYGKIEKFTEYMGKIGNSLKTAQTSYEEASKYISTGKGNILSTANSIISIADKSKTKKQVMLNFDEEE